MILAKTDLSLPMLPTLSHATDQPCSGSAKDQGTGNAYLLDSHSFGRQATSSADGMGSASLPASLAFVHIHDCPILKVPFEEKSQSMSKDDVLAIRTVIETQIEALHNADFTRAYSCVSPATQSQYADAKAFIEAVKTSYEPIFDSHSVVFEDPKEVMGLVSQPVLLLSGEGDMVMASYLMEKLENGDWKINGCYLAPVR
jgi:hypothetical protein